MRSIDVVASQVERGATAPGDTIQGGWHPNESLFFAAEFTKDTGQRITWKTERVGWMTMMTKKLIKNRVTPTWRHCKNVLLTYLLTHSNDNSSSNKNSKIAFLSQAVHPRMHFTWQKMAVTSFDQPYQKSPWCTPTLRFSLFQNGSYFWLKFYIAWTKTFAVFAAVIMTLTRWPLYANLIHIPWKYPRRPKMNFLRQSYRITYTPCPYKKTEMFFCNIFYKTPIILIKFGA